MNKGNVLYLSYTGLLEPLGRSQIFSYLKFLSTDFNLILITFEKEEDLANLELVTEMESLFHVYGIIWRHLRFHRHPRLLAKIWDISHFYILVRKICAEHQVQLVHCRSYIPSLIGLVNFTLHKIPFIFDMRALWPEELVASRRIGQNSFYYKLLKRLEKKVAGKKCRNRKSDASSHSLSDSAVQRC